MEQWDAYDLQTEKMLVPGSPEGGRRTKMEDGGWRVLRGVGQDLRWAISTREILPEILRVLRRFICVHGMQVFDPLQFVRFRPVWDALPVLVEFMK